MIRLTVVLLLLPGAALAECPTAADMAKGVVVTWDAGPPELYRTDPEDAAVVIQESGLGDRLNHRSRLAHGLYLLDQDSVPPDPMQAARYDYGQPPADLPVPAPGESVGVEAALTDMDGTVSEAQETSAGPMQPVEIGGCAFDAYEVTHSYGDGTFREGVLYLPELGIGLFVWLDAGDGQRSTMTPLTIEAAP